MLKKKIITTTLLLALWSGAAMAQETAIGGSSLLSEKFVLIFLVVVMLMALGVILALSRWLINLSNQLREDVLKEKGIELEEETEDVLSSFFKKFQKSMTKAVPVEKEEEIMTDHEYDGIRELDNKLPPWWVGLFYLTIIFAVAYLVYYHVGGWGQSNIESFEASMAKAEEAQKAFVEEGGEVINENTVVALTDEADLAKGREIFSVNCFACHGMQGEGGIGPNLTDQYWIHGGGIKNIYKTIKNGVPAKGMISWKTQLSPKQMQQVGSYILTLQGTNPPNAKEPQGDLYTGEGAATDTGKPATEGDTSTTETSVVTEG